MSLKSLNAAIQISQRDLLQIKLDIYALNYRTSEKVIGFTVGQQSITAYHESASAERSLKLGNDQAIKHFSGWVDSIRLDVAELVRQTLPLLNETFNAIEDVRVEISYSYGMGSILVCTFNGAEAKWHI